MTTVNLNLLASRYGIDRDAVAVYDLQTGAVTGPDAGDIGNIIEMAQKEGYASPIPCTHVPLPPPGTPLTPAQLSAVLAFFWDLSATDLPVAEFEDSTSSDPRVTLIN